MFRLNRIVEAAASKASRALMASSFREVAEKVHLLSCKPWKSHVLHSCLYALRPARGREYLLYCLAGPPKALQDGPWAGLSLSPRMFIAGPVYSSYTPPSVSAAHQTSIQPRQEASKKHIGEGDIVQSKQSSLRSTDRLTLLAFTSKLSKSTTSLSHCYDIRRYKVSISAV